MEEQFLNQILKDTYTVGDFKKRYQFLKSRLQGEIFKSKEGEPEEKHESAKGHALDGWFEHFDKKILDEVTNSNFSQINEYIENFLSGTNLIAIYFVFVPGDPQLKEVGDWLRENLKNPKLIFDVKIDPSLIGGCAIVYKGVYKDYSLRSKITANKGKLMEEFRKYFKQ